MFKNRLRVFIASLACLAAVILVRLVDLQVLHAADARSAVDNLIKGSTQYHRAARGDVTDRAGRILVQDQPASDITVDYAVLTGAGARVLPMYARQLRARGAMPGASREEVLEALEQRLAQTWPRLSAATGLSLEELDATAARIRERVQRVKAAVQARRPDVSTIAEERAFHSILDAIDHERGVALRLDLADLPWVDVAPGARRVTLECEALAHVIGRMGAVTPERMQADPLGDDPLRRLEPGDACGISGIERVADVQLRGQRGLMRRAFGGEVLERRAPERGSAVRLMIDSVLQNQTYATLAEAVRASESPCGGSAVVLDVASREVLALVSYPSYRQEDFDTRFQDLARDTQFEPLRFRAVTAQYPPGSTCKAVTLLGALSDGVTTPEERVHCRGMLMPDKPNQFRCWIYNQFGSTHDDSHRPDGQSGEDAVRNSCNIYFFNVGQRLGPDRLTHWFDLLGLGRMQGSGLIEESPGVNPTASWLRQNRGRDFAPSDVWNYSIGQGEVTATPLQSANLAAAVARGVWAPVILARDAGGAPLLTAAAPAQPLQASALRVLRRGMWRVVNEEGGTATQARLKTPGFELCGKTGSAQAAPRVLSSIFTFEQRDGSRIEIEARTLEEALQQHGAGDDLQLVGRRAAQRFPPLAEDHRLPSHAWFIGYTQPEDTPRGEAPSGRCLAVAVIIEYGGSGGRVAGPVAGAIADLALAARPDALGMNTALPMRETSPQSEAPPAESRVAARRRP